MRRSAKQNNLKRRETEENMMKKIREKKGFTLAELLIVVAIIAVLVAVAIPVFTTQLEKAAEATDIANIRSAYAEAVAEILGSNVSEKEITTVKAQSSGAFDKADTSGFQWASKLPTSVTKGSPFKVKVTIAADGTESVAITQ